MRVAMFKVLNRSIVLKTMCFLVIGYITWAVFSGGYVHYNYLTLLPTIHVLVISLAEVGEERLGGSQMARY